MDEKGRKWTKTARILTEIVIIPLVVVGSFLVGIKVGRRNVWPLASATEAVDTVFSLCTLVVEKPVVRYRRTTDTVRTYLTTVEHDTVRVEVPIERKVYEEDSLYRAVVSGWRVSLDSLTIYPRETIVTVTKTETVMRNRGRFGFGAAIGPSVLATPSGSVHAGLGATVGLTYRF